MVVMPGPRGSRDILPHSQTLGSREMSDLLRLGGGLAAERADEEEWAWALKEYHTPDIINKEKIYKKIAAPQFYLDPWKNME
jgi:hypothetical protein